MQDLLRIDRVHPRGREGEGRLPGYIPQVHTHTHVLQLCACHCASCATSTCPTLAATSRGSSCAIALQVVRGSARRVVRKGMSVLRARGRARPSPAAVQTLRGPIGVLGRLCGPGIWNACHLVSWTLALLRGIWCACASQPSQHGHSTKRCIWVPATATLLSVVTAVEHLLPYQLVHIGDSGGMPLISAASYTIQPSMQVAPHMRCFMLVCRWLFSGLTPFLVSGGISSHSLRCCSPGSTAGGTLICK